MTTKPGRRSDITQPACPTRHLTSPHSHPPLGRTFEMRFTSTPRGARLARRLAAVRLDSWGIPYGTCAHEEIVVVLAELTVNAVRHGHVPGRDFRLRLQLIAHCETVRVEVTDTRAERLPPRPGALPAPGGEGTGGRGLLLVAALASRWDWRIRSDGPGKTVWAEYALAGAASGVLRTGASARP
ncbi:ATP-binding protein [Streptomyces sp. BP-8]|uniref:ATP-binding protein n=1 Tax=Streptomyces sirii TaxID=3127701 RepID=A0ABZ2QU90_9ACTN